MIRRLIGLLALGAVVFLGFGVVQQVWGSGLASGAFASLGRVDGLGVLQDKRRTHDVPLRVNDLTLVNANHPVSANYAPSSIVEPHLLAPKTHAAFERMVEAAASEGLTIVWRYGYRSYETQAGLMAGGIEKYGSRDEARRWIAEAGQSEHQTGLAVDVAAPGVRGIDFQTTREFEWLRAHAHEYGFILRYPQGKEHITGIAYEPWHYRYVTVEHAAKFGPHSNLTLEEYLGGR